MATNFLWFPGTSNNGLVSPVLTLMTTELQSLASTNVVASSASFTNANTGQAIWADLFFFPGVPAVTATAGASLTGWFLTTPDGTAQEILNGTPPRAPDFNIPLPAGAIGAVNIVYRSAGIVRVPALPFKVLVQNNAGVALSAGGTNAPYLKMAPYAVQY